MRPWHALLLLFCSARGSVVHQPSPSRPLATTTLKFFGPQTFSLSATGSPLVELDAASLVQIHRSGRASAAEVMGTIVMFSLADLPDPDMTWLYIALERAGATAALVTTTLFKIPGGLYYCHGGSGALARHGAMPMMQVAWSDVRDLMEAAHGNETVSLLLEPSENTFLPFWHSLPWLLAMRGLMPLVGFSAGALALRNLREHVRFGGRRILWPPTKPIMVLVSEMVVCPLLGAVYLGGPQGSTDIFSIHASRFFFTFLMGWSLFTTLIMALHWNESNRLSDISRHSNRAEHCGYRGPCAVFVLTVMLDSVISTLSMFNVIGADTDVLTVAMAFYMAAQLGASFYFFNAAWSIKPLLRGVASPEGDEHLGAHFLHMTRWLAVSGVCMVLVLFGGCVVAFQASTGLTLSSYFISFLLLSLGRFNTSLAQVKSLDLPRTTRPFFDAVTPDSGGARPAPRFLLQQMILGRAPAGGVTAGDEASNGGGVAQIELTEFSLAFAGILARVDLHSGRATVLTSRQHKPPAADLSGARDDAATRGDRVSRVALAAVEALFDPEFVGQWMRTTEHHDEEDVNAVEIAETYRDRARRRRLLPERGDPFAFLRSQLVGWRETVLHLHVSSAEDGPYVAELRKISESALTVLIVNDANAPIRRHDFHEAMATAQTEHQHTMAAAQAEHERLICEIHHAYGAIYDTLAEDPGLLSLRYHHSGNPAAADGDAEQECDLEDQASGAESSSYPHPSPHYRRPTAEGSAISSLTRSSKSS